MSLSPPRHRCLTCGTCCQGVYVEVGPEEVPRIEEAARALGVEDPIDDGGLRFENGRCVFLGEDLLCDIHRRFGGEAKPVRRKSTEARRVGEYEKRIADLEERQALRSKELSRPEIYQDQPRYQELLAAFTQDQRKLEELLQRWERAQADFDAEQE